ncbi:MAG: SPW repeat protein [Rhizobiales bacterium]|nr:SPW repeat protein [Hyphomicrobiales bacterium]
MPRWRPESVLDIYNLVLAIVLFASTWFLSRATAATDVDFWICAAAIGIISIAAVLAFAWWEEWINLLLGFWLIASPWLLGFTHTNAMHYSIGIGVVVAFMAALEIWLVYDKEDEALHPELREDDQPLVPRI